MKLEAIQTAKYERPDGGWSYEFDLLRDDLIFTSGVLVCVERWATESDIRKELIAVALSTEERNARIKDAQDKIPPDFSGKINIPGKP